MIEHGNEVFVQISGYEREVMIGAPHSIIRHPAMPRSIFQLFWETIQAQEPIGAYVNNLAADGSNYWVFAVAFPVTGGYLSIRLRPSSTYHEQTKALYEDLLQEEAKNGMEGGRRLLEARLSSLGFRDYRAFMTAALSAELDSRDLHLRELSNSGPSAQHQSQDPVTAKIRDLNTRGSLLFREAFKTVNGFVEAKSVFSKHTDLLLEQFKTIRYLSINMTVSAEKFGADARTLSVISGQFQKMASEIETHLKSFLGIVEGLNLDLQEAIFGISNLKIQMDMVDFFVGESLQKAQAEGADSARAFEDLEVNRAGFEELSATSLRQAQKSLASLREKLFKFSTSLDEIRTFGSGLEIVRQMGSMESARKTYLQAAFENQISELKSFTDTLHSSSQHLIDSTQTLMESAALLDQKIPLGGKFLGQIFATALDHRKPTLLRAAS